MAMQMNTGGADGNEPEVMLEMNTTPLIDVMLVLIIMLIGFVLHFIPEEIEKKAQQLVVKMPLIFQCCFFILVVLLVIQFKSSEIQPFIYFQF